MLTSQYLVMEGKNISIEKRLNVMAEVFLSLEIIFSFLCCFFFFKF